MGEEGERNHSLIKEIDTFDAVPCRNTQPVSQKGFSMNYRFIVILLILGGLTAGCRYLNPGEEIQVNLGVNAQTPIDDTHRLYVRFADQYLTKSKPAEYINGLNNSGWGWEKGHGLRFPRSGVLTAEACLQPDLFGFIDIHKSEGPKVTRDIDLIKAMPANLKTESPQNEAFILKEFGLIAQPKFSLSIKGTRHEVTSICSANFSHFPEIDYAIDFQIIAGSIVMKKDEVPSLNLDLDDAKAKGIDETTVTVMGLTKIDGKRVGFTASATLPLEVE